MSGLSPERREELALVIGALPEAYNVFDHTDEATTFIKANVDLIADALAPLIAEWINEARVPAVFLADDHEVCDQQIREAREAGAAEVRAQVWNALNDVIADHPMWIGGDGQPLDYSPEREARVHDFIREVSAALNGGE